jgi:hypothetical protein
MDEKEAANIFFAIITKPIPNKISNDSVKVRRGP